MKKLIRFYSYLYGAGSIWAIMPAFCPMIDDNGNIVQAPTRNGIPLVKIPQHDDIEALLRDRLNILGDFERAYNCSAHA